MPSNNPKYYTDKEQVEKGLGKGIFTIPSDPELIPSQAAQDSLGWISDNGKIELCRGKIIIGAEETATGYVKGEGWGYNVNGIKIHFRKVNTVIQYYNTTTKLWVNIITGLTSSAEYTFSSYQSVAGTFVFATGIDGIFKIHTANPGSYSTMCDSTSIYKGYSIIVNSRMIMWNLPTDKTGLYGSHIDPQNSSVYTTVTGEATTSLTGTLAFKAGDVKRTCFGIVLTITSGGEKYTDNRDGTLTGSAGGTGTINYTTGAYTISASGVGTVNYLWEMTNTKGITDFSSSATRLAAEGFILSQSEGGDSIQQVLIATDNSIISLKQQSAYQLTIDSTDLIFNNQIFRKNIGIEYWRNGVSTSKGIIFLDTSNITKPRLTILQKDITGTNLEPVVLATQFDFSKYIWDMCAMGTYGETILFFGRTKDSTINNKLFVYNIRLGTVDILPYSGKTITNSDGLLYIGDTITDNIYNILSGWDDDGQKIENYWISSDDKYGNEYLKKTKRIRFKGLITPTQKLEVYDSLDNGDFQLVGTILGSGVYVDFSETFTIGSAGIGSSIIGGESDYLDGNFYLAELKLKLSKFRKRTLMLKATGTGYVSVNMIDDFKIMTFEQKLPKKYRQKQNVSLDGTKSNQ